MRQARESGRSATFGSHARECEVKAARGAGHDRDAVGLGELGDVVCPDPKEFASSHLSVIVN